MDKVEVLKLTVLDITETGSMELVLTQVSILKTKISWTYGKRKGNSSKLRGC